MASSLHASAVLIPSSAACIAGSAVSQTSAPCRRSRCAPIITCSKQESAGEATASRRAVFLGLGAASLAVLASSPSADAADIPIFGIKKKAIQAVQSATSAVEGAASEAESLVAGAVSLPSISLSPPLQAAVVAGAEVVAVAVAAAVVGGVTSTT